MIILAIDLGEFNSTVMFFDNDAKQYSFQKVVIPRWYLTSRSPDRFGGTLTEDIGWTYKHATIRTTESAAPDAGSWLCHLEARENRSQFLGKLYAPEQAVHGVKLPKGKKGDTEETEEKKAVGQMSARSHSNRKRLLGRVPPPINTGESEPGLSGMMPLMCNRTVQFIGGQNVLSVFTWR